MLWVIEIITVKVYCNEVHGAGGTLWMRLFYIKTIHITSKLVFLKKKLKHNKKNNLIQFNTAIVK
jgi:hypothetical protein